jgi:hypothetical protein
VRPGEGKPCNWHQLREESSLSTEIIFQMSEQLWEPLSCCVQYEMADVKDDVKLLKYSELLSVLYVTYFVR